MSHFGYAQCDTFFFYSSVSMHSRINLITLGVSDLAVSQAFYQRLGFELSTSSQEGSVAFLKTGGAVLSLFPKAELAKDAMVSAEGSGFQGITLAQNVENKEDVDTFLKEAEAAGAVITKPAQDVFWGGYNGYFKDPDGYLWEVAWNPFFPFDERGQVVLP